MGHAEKLINTPDAANRKPARRFVGTEDSAVVKPAEAEAPASKPARQPKAVKSAAERKRITRQFVAAELESRRPDLEIHDGGDQGVGFYKKGDMSSFRGFASWRFAAEALGFIPARPAPSKKPAEAPEPE